MPTWDELFERGECIARFAEREVSEFVDLVERRFADRPLSLWDLCCGAGRHTVVMAERGHSVFASDNAPNGVALTIKELAARGLSAETAVSDMTICPWPGVRFHGVLSWAALHHNTLDGVRSALETAKARLLPGGPLLCTLKSRNADSYGLGDETEPNTFVQDSGPEAGVPHHYFDEAEIRDVFSGWNVEVLVERRCDYRVRCQDFPDGNPFDYTTWGVLAARPRAARTCS